MLTTKNTFRCHNCNKEFTIDVPVHVNSKKHPEEVRRIIDGSNFVSRCPYCGETTFIAYPITYINDQKHIVVLSGPYDGLLYRKFVEHIDDDYPGYKVIGVCTPTDFHNIVTLIEKGYDYHAGMVAVYLIAQKKHLNIMKKHKDAGELDLVLLSEDKDGGLYLNIHVENIEHGFSANFEKLFSTFNQYGLDIEWNDRDLFIYSKDSIQSLIQADREKAGYEFQFAFIDSNRRPYLCFVNNFLNNHLRENQTVSFIDKEGCYQVGRYITTVTIENKHLLLSEWKNFATVVGPTPGEYKLGIEPVDESIDNSEILELLNKRKKGEKYDNDRLQSLLGQTKIVFSTDLSFLFMETDKHFELCGYRDNKHYIRVWLSKEAADGRDNTYMINFDDAVRLAMDNSFDGILVNEDSDEIILNTEFLESYKHCKTMCNHDLMVELLSSFTKEEADYIGEIGLNIINYAYEEGVDCFKEAEKVYGYTHEETGDILDEAYEKMMHVVNYRFNIESESREDAILS